MRVLHGPNVAFCAVGTHVCPVLISLRARQSCHSRFDMNALVCSERSASVALKPENQAKKQHRAANGARGHSRFPPSRAMSSEARGATPCTITSLSRLFAPRVRASELRGTAKTSAKMRIRRSFAAPSTGGDDTRTRNRPSRTPSMPSCEARGCMRRRSNRSAPRTAYQTGSLVVNGGGSKSPEWRYMPTTVTNRVPPPRGSGAGWVATPARTR